MKEGLVLLVTVFAFAVSLSCANGKQIPGEAPEGFGEAYFTTWTGGVKTAGSGLNLYIPVEAALVDRIELDSVYFRGKKAKLELRKDELNSDSLVYVAYFRTSEKQKTPDLVMHRDPKKEFGNKVPEVVRDFPFELEEHEAMLSYKKDGQTGYYKISGIENRPGGSDPKIKRPQDLQH